MQARTPVKPISFQEYKNNLGNLINYMEKSEIPFSSDLDQKSADNQFAFVKDAHQHLEKILDVNGTLSKIIENIMSLGKLTIRYFGKDEIPKVEGKKSQIFALVLASHFKELAKIQFPKEYLQRSIFLSKLPFINTRSLPELIEHRLKLAEKIEKNVEAYNKQHAASASLEL